MVKDTNKVVHVSKDHSNKNSYPSVEASLVDNQEGNILNSKLLFIPDSVDLDKILVDNPPNFRYHKDYFIHLMHLINAIPIRNKDLLDKNDGFTPINKRILQSKNRNYRNYINYLKDVGVIIEDKFYKPNSKSQGLKFSSKYNTDITPIVITKKTLVKSLSKYGKTINAEKTKDYSFLKKWFNENLEINAELSIDILKKEFLEDLNNPEIKNPRLRLNSRLIPVQKLYRKDFDFFVDESGERLHTNITSLKSSLRSCLTYNGDNLISIDIKNSQPYLAISLLDSTIFNKLRLEYKIPNEYIKNEQLKTLIKSIENEPDVLLFKALVSSGRFYEEFRNILIERKIIDPVETLREEVKEIVFEAIYSSNKNNSPTSKVFKTTFPNVNKVFSMIKAGKGKKPHNALAKLLQRLEADLILNKTCRIINDINPEIPIFTIHDNIATTKKYAKLIKRVLKRVLKFHIGVKPKLKTEYW